MDIKNPEIFLEAPLLIIAFALMVTGIPLIESDFRIGFLLIFSSIVVVIIEKLVERWDSKGKI